MKVRAKVPQWAAGAVLAGAISLACAGAGAQEQDRLFLPPVWDDDAMLDLVDDPPGGVKKDGEGEDWPVVPGVAGTEDVVPAGAADPIPAVAGEERAEPQPAQGIAEDAASSSLLGYLGDRKETPVRPPEPVPGLAGAAAALFGCPRSVLEDLLRAATAKADVVSSLEIEREVLTLCAERQALVLNILQAEAELGLLWSASRAPEPEARPEPVDVLAQLTEFEGARVLEFVEEPLEPEPEPEPEPETPSYGWWAIFGVDGDLQARVSNGSEVWFVREGDELPGGVVVEWISVTPPGVHVMRAGEDEILPYRTVQGEGG